MEPLVSIPPFDSKPTQTGNPPSTVAVAEVYTSCGIVAVVSGSTVPFRCLNSRLCGVEKTVTVLPDWLVNVKLCNVTRNCVS